MSQNISVHFIGTTSGGGPTETRNCSSLVVEPFGNGQLWMVDCAEGTVRQFERQPYRPGQQRLRVGQVTKIFITHMHADHTMGILTFLRNALGIPKPPSTVFAKVPPPNKRSPRVEIFGPRGIRRMVRMLWHMTHTHSEFSYVVHELLFTGEQPSVSADVGPDEEGVDEADIRRDSECVGRDIWCDEQGFWKGIVDVTLKQAHGNWGAVVDAGPIQHRDPCIGYIIREIPRYLTPESPLPRKLVILGDTYDPSTIIPLVHADGAPSAPSSSKPSTSDPLASTSSWSSPHIDFSVLPVIIPHDNEVRVRVPVTLLVHEATDAYLPPHVDPQQRTGKNRTPESVTEKAVLRGHSTPAMAGAFARAIAAERLVMNHIGARFPGPDMEHNQYHGGRNQFRISCMREIERQAAEAWNPKRRMQPYVQAAWDFLTVSIPPNERRPVTDVDAVDVSRQAGAVVRMGTTVADGFTAASSTSASAFEIGTRSYAQMDVEDMGTRAQEVAGDAGEFETSMQVSASEEDGGTVVAATTGSATTRSAREELDAVRQRVSANGGRSEKKRRAPTSDSPPSGSGSGRWWDDGRGRGRSGEPRRGFSSSSGGAGGAGGGGRRAHSPASGKGRYHGDRERRSRTGEERDRRGRGGAGS